MWSALTTTMAQWDVPVRIVLDGEGPADRQVTGLADPIQRDAAVSLDAARHNVLNHALASGSDVLTATLLLAPEAYTAGMSLILECETANADSAVLDLNGTGPVPLLRPDGHPVRAGDLRPGEPIRLVYLGGNFHVLSTITRPCPPAFTAIGRDYCIADTAQAASPFYQANLACHDQGARLCTFAEWINACQRIPGFFDTVLEFEWVDHAANSSNHAKRVGYGSNGQGIPDGAGCNFGGSIGHTNPTRFRCCTNR